ncbi:MAG TPA: glycerol-3-phosphate 1-O-acyltransferase PlsY [Syntrophorhabdus sp.]|jgi:glycerol-3-phosphate acyltransferase PlsY|nr:glycerol-3-phosphate 1-O-acyltransferase PlsY [Syntrophorhabdus sp.]MDI9558140.1 glycerol-3-phosphate 1-O-acyltransferase PlsY [Pseudomonadota bacterium]OPX93812.1 MAG: putative glycerol-3-phosphate acyltransferase [Syntrophorhabdus sp. PtaB.Bin027]OQB77877.1 MAG: putative glycerol-3-phosphate acyltransferase [Deltaproteobacteria bacterium ADurb.Bin135]HNQ46568.1 glycerol-3-phosphate 1-O-acyltransferase PlsY [Syntrophorhabdus sp.]
MHSYFLIVFAYLLGSVPVGLLLSKIKGADPRAVGSGNIGATNVMRAAGKITGALTLIGDVLKGLIPVMIAFMLGETKIIVTAAGLAAFLGHLFPVFLRFKGGKGVATALGVYLGLDPFAVLIAIIIFVLTISKWGFVSLGSLVGVAAMPLLLYFLSAPVQYIYLVLIIGALIFIKHKDNIRRLVAGTENKIGKS